VVWLEQLTNYIQIIEITLFINFWSELYNVANLDHNYIVALRMNSRHVISHQIGMLL
jgi:hypothetical protein